MPAGCVIRLLELLGSSLGPDKEADNDRDSRSNSNNSECVLDPLSTVLRFIGGVFADEDREEYNKRQGGCYNSVSQSVSPQTMHN